MAKTNEHSHGRDCNTDNNSELGAITVAETLIALGIGATVLATVFAGLPALIESRNSSTGLSGLAQISTAVRTTFGGRNNFIGLTTPLAMSLSGFPQNFIVGGNAKHPWGGDIVITGEGQSFTVEFKEMPSKACSSMVASSIQLADSVNVGGQPINLNSNIGELCKSNDNDIEWKFSS